MWNKLTNQNMMDPKVYISHHHNKEMLMHPYYPLLYSSNFINSKNSAYDFGDSNLLNLSFDNFSNISSIVVINVLTRKNLVCLEPISFSKSFSFMSFKNSFLYFFIANIFLALPFNPNFDHIISVINTYTKSRSILFSFSKILLFSTNTSITFSHLKTFINTAFNADIIIDGFCLSVKMHNLIYNQIIRDGDSSVIKKIQIAKPYGNEIISSRLRDLSTKRKSASGLIVPGFIRTKIKKNLLRLRKNMHLPQNKKVKLLKIDILNWPFHVFGFHNKCNKFYLFMTLIPLLVTLKLTNLSLGIPKIKKKIIFGLDSKYDAIDEELGCQPLAMTKEDFEDKKIQFLEKLKLNKTDIFKLER
ncbi:hypothetical protein AGLY_016735 [Aphis glycines]|uniref:Mutator-like transposase domain-containing protein n=1 Tax=Aphis glycines TaxID=307491 RepID=A0A6G0SWW7_APHGL|nr:hypothetical protein AGLY_016735 [Aphis glycines]